MAKIDGHDYVEIAGIKWATMNIGANSVTDYGTYFQWGDTAGYYFNQVGSSSTSYKKPFGWADYKLCNNSSSPGTTGFTKYNSTDGKTILDVCDDHATNNWGGRWRTPTADEFLALSAATTSAFTTNYQGSGVSGFVLTDKTDSSKVLFFPYGGDCYDNGTYRVGSNGYYWSSTLYTSNIQHACFVEANRNEISWGGNALRYVGCNIRAVAEGSFSRTLFWKVAPTTIDIGNTLSIEAVPTIHENDGVLQYTSSDPNIVKILGSSIVGVSNGSCTITATITEGTFTNSASTSFSVTCSGSHAGHEYVSLGLPSGTLWATMNVGALTETASGKYYVYGAGQYDYSQNRSPYSGMEKPLPSSKDTATQVWGGSWRTPSSDQCNELIDHTTITWETNFKGSGVTGAKLTAANGQYLFFPACGAYFNGSIEDVNVRAYSWTSTPPVSASYGNRDAQFLLLRDCDGRTGSYYRQYGYPVRPVYKKITYEYVDLGLPSGTKWAKTNVGAETETEYGGYYMYGSENSESYYSGTEDPLPSSADTATQVMGSQWHMPTQGQFNELRNNTTFSFTNINGVRGAKFTADNGNYIFLPCAGYAEDSDVYYTGSTIFCWTSNNQGSSGGAYALKSNGGYSINMIPRQLACSVRGVIGSDPGPGPTPTGFVWVKASDYSDKLLMKNVPIYKVGILDGASGVSEYVIRIGFSHIPSPNYDPNNAVNMARFYIAGDGTNRCSFIEGTYSSKDYDSGWLYFPSAGLTRQTITLLNGRSVSNIYVYDTDYPSPYDRGSGPMYYYLHQYNATTEVYVYVDSRYLT